MTINNSKKLHNPIDDFFVGILQSEIQEKDRIIAELKGSSKEKS